MRKLCVALIIGIVSLTSSVQATLVVGNSAAFGSGPIRTFDLSTGLQVNSFIPQGSIGNSNNGRGLAVTNTLVYYTELSGGFGPSDGIHIAPWNGGAGGADIAVLPNPLPGKGIQDLAFGPGGATGIMYALAGYPNQAPVVFSFDSTTGALINQVTINNNVFVSDGFTVLPNGNFLINNGDQSPGSLVYKEYDKTTGNPTGFVITLPGNQGNRTATGVDYDPVSNTLFFQTGFNSFTQTDLAGNVLSVVAVPGNTIEDISIIQPFNPPPPGQVPEPATMLLVGVGIAGLLRARKKIRG